MFVASEDAQGPDLHGPKAKGQTRIPKATRRSGKARGQRPVTDHAVEKDLEDYLTHFEKGYDPFGSDDAFSDEFSDEDEPARKKSKHDDSSGNRGAGAGGEFSVQVDYMKYLFYAPSEFRQTSSIYPSSARPNLCISSQILEQTWTESIEGQELSSAAFQYYTSKISREGGGASYG